MRHDQPDEADDPGHRHAAPHRQPDAEDQPAEHAARHHPERTRGGISQCQRIQSAGGLPQAGDTQQRQRGGEIDVGPAAIGQRAHQPGDDLAHRKGIGGKADGKARQRPGKACDHQARQREEGDPAGAARYQRQQRHGAPCADQREERQQVGRGGIAEPEARHRPQRRARRDAEQAGIGERIAQIALHGRPGRAQPCADRDRQHGARQPQLGKDHSGIGRARRVQPDTARQQREREGEREQAEKEP